MKANEMKKEQSDLDKKFEDLIKYEKTTRFLTNIFFVFFFVTAAYTAYSLFRVTDALSFTSDLYLRSLNKPMTYR